MPNSEVEDIFLRICKEVEKYCSASNCYESILIADKKVEDETDFIEIEVSHSTGNRVDEGLIEYMQDRHKNADNFLKLCKNIGKYCGLCSHNDRVTEGEEASNLSGEVIANSYNNELNHY